jgi:hypothetical protein
VERERAQALPLLPDHPLPFRPCARPWNYWRKKRIETKGQDHSRGALTEELDKKLGADATTIDAVKGVEILRVGSKIEWKPQNSTVRKS